MSPLLHRLVLLSDCFTALLWATQFKLEEKVDLARKFKYTTAACGTTAVRGILFPLDEQLIVNAMDLFSAGSETTATTLAWAVAFMILHPEVHYNNKLRCTS